MIPLIFNRDFRIEKEAFVQSFYNTFPYNIDPDNYYSKKNLPKGQLPDLLFKSVKKNDIILDIGCGVGRYLRVFRYLGCSPIGVDQSLETLVEVKNEMKDIHLLNASNLLLPIKSNTGDWIISAGVIHHTGNTRKAFDELVRICKPRGRIYLMVYRKWSSYYFIYFSAGTILRFIFYRIPLGKIMTRGILMPLFHRVDNLINRKNRTLEKSVSLYADYFLQPIATFHTYSEIVKWCKARAVGYKQFPKNHPDMVSVIITR